MTLAAGSLVADRYRVVGELGRGGVATVYRALDTRFNVDVALKVATLTGDAYGLSKARFAREARIGYRLGRSEGLIRALDWGEVVPGETLFVTMDLVEGARPLDPCQGPRLARLRSLLVAASLVARVHGHGVIHRDIKPGNFLVSRRGRISLSDFGEALDAREAETSDETRITRTGATVGTPIYMAPEQFEDSHRVDVRADVYSLGVMLYQSLTGTYPYEAPNTIALMCQLVQARSGLAPIARSPRERDPTVPPELDRLCMAAIALDRERRLASVPALLKELRRHAPPDRPSGVMPRPPAPTLKDDLGLDADGFTTRETLRRLSLLQGEEALRAKLAGVPALVVREEREVEGKTLYLGRVGFLLPGATPGEVTIGRGAAADLRIRLVTMSSLHARLRRVAEGWTLSDLGTTNGTWLNGERLRPGEEAPVASSDVVRFAEHISLELLWPGDLCAEVAP